MDYSPARSPRGVRRDCPPQKRVFSYIWTTLEIVANGKRGVMAPPNVKAQSGAPRGRLERAGRWKPAGARNVRHFPRVSGSYSCILRGPVCGRQVPISCPIGRIDHGRT